MKYVVIFLSGILFCGCASHRSANVADGVNTQKQRAGETKQTALFLHLLSPKYYTNPAIPPSRIVSTQVYLGEEIWISVGQDPWPVLNGKIDVQDGKFVAHLQGVAMTTGNMFDGEFELEKPVGPQTLGGSGAFFSAYFLLSTNADCRAVLQKLTLD